jgi:hypothetical protein
MSVSFNSNEYEGGFDPFANGLVNVQITDYGDDPNSAGTGEYVWFEFTILNGADKGRTFRQFYNYLHQNEKAEKIAREQLCALARACGVDDIVLPEKAGAFNNRKLTIFLKQKKGDDFPAIKEYSPFQSADVSFEDLEDGQAERDPFSV